MPPIVETFSPIILEIKVYLLETAITKPITRIIDKAKLNEFDKEATILALFEKTKQNFANLFELLKLKKINDSLIKIPLKKLIHLDESLLDNKNHNFNKESLKMNMRDPYQKLPKQASLFDFATQNIEKNKQILLENNNITEPKPYKSAEDESLDIDYENLFQHDTITHEKTPFLDPPSSFKSLLHPYQKQALAWMLKQEGVIMNFDEKNKNNQNFESQIQGNHEKLVKNLEDIEIKIEPTKNEIEQLENKTEKNENKQYSNRTLRTLHPLWEQYAFSDGTHCFFNPYSGQLSLEIPISNSGCKGGILADEMGLGKTVMMISLFHTNSGKSNRQKEEKAIKFQKNNILLSNSIYKYANTLIIVPLTLLSQWEEELKLHSAPDHFKICLYYADFRPIDLYKYDIVITTYGTISSEYANQKQDLFQYEWFRVVLDEAHYIKGRTIQIAKAVYNLKAINRWCMTGTPIQNKLDDLFSLIHFLRLEPWSDYIWWSSYINKPYEKKDPMVFEIIRTIIAPILLRRTKKARNKNGKSIIDLPEKETSIEWVDFSKEENNLYREVYQKSKMEFDDLLSKGVFLSNYMHVFDILTRF